MITGFCHDSRFTRHDTGIGHPERPERMTAALRHLDHMKWRTSLTDVTARLSSVDWIKTVHNPAYIARAEAACKLGQSHLDSMDVAISSESYKVARLAVGAALSLADEVITGKIDNGFALIRPPGHHAENDAALGFCLFNNIAILARYLQVEHGLEKIAIVDWDVHHGNGTQHTFEADPTVMYVSTHQYPYYPGTGSLSEQGEGRGKGSIVNCPMPAGADDRNYELAFIQKVIPALDKFAPDAILISAGFDAHKSDPLAEISLSTEFFSWMTMRLLEIADKHAAGRVISLLEGGYNLDTLGPCISAHLETLMMLRPSVD